MSRLPPFMPAASLRRLRRARHRRWPVSTGCGGPTTAIAGIRHPGGWSPLDGRTTSIEVVVTAAFGGYTCLLRGEAGNLGYAPATSPLAARLQAVHA